MNLCNFQKDEVEMDRFLSRIEIFLAKIKFFNLKLSQS